MEVVEVMPKGKPDTESPTRTAKIDRAIMAKATIISTDLGVSLSDYLSDRLRGVVDADWNLMLCRAGESQEALAQQQ